MRCGLGWGKVRVPPIQYGGTRSYEYKNLILPYLVVVQILSVQKYYLLYFQQIAIVVVVLSHLKILCLLFVSFIFWLGCFCGLNRE